jgi:hypothetical protein
MALSAFVTEMKVQARWQDVTVVSTSEFGRTITSNGAGTDHGWAGNHFVLGGSVRGGQIFGTYPNDLTDSGEQSMGRGRIIPTTPWEGVWAPVAEWFGVGQERMAEVLPNLANFQLDEHIVRVETMFHMPPTDAAPPSPPTAPPPRRVDVLFSMAGLEVTILPLSVLVGSALLALAFGLFCACSRGAEAPLHFTKRHAAWRL